MRIDGMWHLCDDGFTRPIIRGEILAIDGSWFKVPFLVDSGADRTVFSADVLSAQGLQPIQTPDQLSGAGGTVDSTVVQTQIRFDHDLSAKALFSGQFAGCMDVASLDISVLGRNILNLFALILDRRGDVVCLVGQQHFYAIGMR